VEDTVNTNYGLRTFLQHLFASSKSTLLLQCRLNRTWNFCWVI